MAKYQGNKQLQANRPRAQTDSALDKRDSKQWSSGEMDILTEAMRKSEIQEDENGPKKEITLSTAIEGVREPTDVETEQCKQQQCNVLAFEIPPIIHGDNDIGRTLRKLSLDRDERLDHVETELIGRPPCEEDYENIKLISNGAYGAVYLVRHKESKQRYAMKKINKHSLVLRNQVEQVFAERDIMSFTDNPFVVSMFCSFETKRYLCMVMEYVEGGDCATLLKAIGPLPVDLARFYFGETVLAVEYLHSYGIVHRDLKPDNLLITGMGHIKLTDFGLSKIGLMNLATNLYEGYLERDSKQFNDGDCMGTPEYIAPEVILRRGYGKPVDWWSMGIILYEFLIGCVPFFGNTTEELFAHVINDEIEWPENEDWPLPEDAKQLISQLLQQNPLDRLGASGPHEVKQHSFFIGLNWNALLRQKAEFVPHLEDDEDTSYFDTRTDRYNHEMEDSDEQEETDDSMFSSFSSCSPRYHQVYSRIERELAQERLLKSSSTSSISDEGTSKPETPTESNLMRTKSLNEGRQTPATQVTPRRPSPLSGSPTKEHAKARKPDSTTSTSGESDSTKVPRRKNTISKSSLPRFSISLDVDESGALVPPMYVDGATSSPNFVGCSPLAMGQSSSPYHSSPRIPIPSNAATLTKGQRNRAVIKSASASGLSLIIPANDGDGVSRGLGPNSHASPGHSSTSSRDASPNRGMNSLCSQLKPLIIIRKGARGFGFTLKAIRVYYGDSDVYTVHHLVMSVENNSPAFEAGLRPGDLITHINGEPIQGLLHHQVLQLVLSGGDKISIRTTPLENTTIKTGGRKRNPVTSKMIRRRTVNKHKKGPPVKRTDSDKKRKSSLLRRLSSRRASAEIQQLILSSSCATPSSPVLTPSRSYHSLSRNSAGTSCTTPKDSAVQSPLTNTPTPSPFTWHLLTASNSNRLLRSPPSNRLPCSPSDSPPANFSSQSSSPGSSIPNSPANLAHSPHFPRPSSLHGLKHKLVQRWSPRRKSCGNIPLSPLARTPSPSVLPLVTTTAVSPTRSTPPPLAFPVGGHHQAAGSSGSGNCSQASHAFKMQKSSSTSTATLGDLNSDTRTTKSIVSSLISPSIIKRSSRPKSAEPASPLLSRSNTPDHSGSVAKDRELRSKLPALRIKRENHSISSPLVTSSPPSLSKVAVTNCFAQSTARNIIMNNDEEGMQALREKHHASRNSMSSQDMSSTSDSDCSRGSCGSGPVKTDKQNKQLYKTTVSIVLSSTSPKSKPSTEVVSDQSDKTPVSDPVAHQKQQTKTVADPVPQADSVAAATTSSKEAKKAATKESTDKVRVEKSGSKPCSPVSIRKSLFRSLEKRSKSATRLEKSASSGSVKDHK